MRVLAACEMSGEVRRAFRALGHDAWSNDLVPALDGDEHHLQCDVLEAIRGQHWDLVVAFPPCTYLCVSGLHWNGKRPGRSEQTEEALNLVKAILESDVDKIALENPVGCISTRLRQPDQIIQPYQFGHDASKKTCLWLKNLSPLVPTKSVEPSWFCCGVRLRSHPSIECCSVCGRASKALPRWGNQTPSGQNKLGPSADRGALRGITYRGIAEAMAAQWGGQA